MTLYGDIDLSDLYAGNYTIKVLGRYDDQQPVKFEFKIIVISSVCKTATFTATAPIFRNTDPLGSITFDANVLYHFKLEQRHSMAGRFSISHPLDCLATYKLYNRADSSLITTTHSGISLQIDPASPLTVILVVNYPENMGKGTLDGSGKPMGFDVLQARLEGTFLGIATKKAFVDFSITFHTNCFATIA